MQNQDHMCPANAQSICKFCRCSQFQGKMRVSSVRPNFCTQSLDNASQGDSPENMFAVTGACSSCRETPQHDSGNSSLTRRHISLPPILTQSSNMTKRISRHKVGDMSGRVGSNVHL